MRRLATACAITMALLWLLGIASGRASAQSGTGVIRVATTGRDTIGCGSPTYPCRTIQYAVDQAETGDTILIAAGVYTDIHARSGVTQVVYIDKSVTLRGGYPPTGWEAPSPADHPTILDARGQGRVLFLTGNITPTIEGLHITGGDATGLGGGPGGFDAGGGIYIYRATATVRNNVIQNNVASTTGQGYGGGICIYRGNALVSGNTIQGNTASTTDLGEGGGLSLAFGQATIEGNTVRENTASFLKRGSGGGVHVYYASAALQRNRIEGNTASRVSFGYGGGIRALWSDVTLVGNTIRGNVASVSSAGFGGGLELWYAHATIEGNAIISNTATSRSGHPGLGGGIDIYRSAPITVTNTLIVQNHANTRGGGVHIEGGPGEPASARLLHTTIADNRGEGPGILVGEGATLALTNTIIAGHYKVGLSVAQGSTATLEATLWWGNGSNMDGEGTISTGAIHVTGDPAFWNPMQQDYHLTLRSAAIDRGVDAGVPQDVDGDPRPARAGYDIGADEYIDGTYTYQYLPLMLRARLGNAVASAMGRPGRVEPLREKLFSRLRPARPRPGSFGKGRERQVQAGKAGFPWR
ncbi:MAG: DUF1565 domain-containing protein [Chloroflexi bacterium]|nr:DUF1565 domain-containing protein [Chloroflexota bacterium]